MLKLLFLFTLFINLYAIDKVEVYASSMDTKGSTVEANGGVSVIYKDYVLSAQRAIYNKKSGDLELFENIRVTKGRDYKILGKYAKLNIAKKEKIFEPFYMSELESKVWMSGKEGTSKENDIKISSGSLSGCNPLDPLWKMEFSSSDYNSKTKWMNLYNTRLYIGSVPILYTPYFGYSLDTTRRSGLLMPSFGVSDHEGIFYEQPLYIAEYNWWDTELKPQLRTSRGSGIYQTTNFVDSRISHGQFSTGYFKENKEYFEQNELQNDSHFGFDFDYVNNDFINQWLGAKFEGQSGIYIDISHMNDVDYINLSSSDTQNNSTATQILSRLNMFYNTNDNYLGAYLKYYQDLTVSSNDDTAQKLPSLQYHYYLDALLQDHLLYSLDIKSNNITRSINKKVIQTDMNIPISLQTPLFDEYLNLAYKANVYVQHSKFTGNEDTNITGAPYNDGYILRNHHTLSLNSELTRAYDDMTHFVGFGISYNKAGTESKNGFYSDNDDFCSNILNVDSRRCEFYNISAVKEEAQIDFVQYLYDASAKEILYHRLAQRISYGEVADRYGELENELDVKLTNYLKFYNNMFYNYSKDKFSKIFNSATFSNYGANFGVSHLYKNNFNESSQQYTSYLTSTLSYTYNSRYFYNGQYSYDIEREEAKSMAIGFIYKKRCWDFGIKYSENNRPILTTSGESSVYDKYIYLTIVLKPLMQSNSESFLTYQLAQE